LVKSVSGRCPLYQVGDKIIIEDFYINSSESSNVCLHAFSALVDLLSAFLHGSSASEIGIGTVSDVGYLQCPDPGPPYTKGGTVLFELRREAIK
jgi:uncharacterized repeat protein (TIGR04076 family)